MEWDSGNPPYIFAWTDEIDLFMVEREQAQGLEQNEEWGA